MQCLWASPIGSDGKESACNTETHVQSLSQEDPLEKEMATHSSILAWKIPRPATVHGAARVRHDEQLTLSTSLSKDSCWSGAGCSVHDSSQDPGKALQGRPSPLMLWDGVKLAQPVGGKAGASQGWREPKGHTLSLAKCAAHEKKHWPQHKSSHALGS